MDAALQSEPNEAIADPARIWWLRPSWITLLWIVVLALSLASSADTYALVARTRKYLDPTSFVILATGLAAFWLGSLLFERRHLTGQRSADYAGLLSRRVMVATFILLAAMLTAYVLWLGPALNAGTLSAILSAEYGSEYGRKVTMQVAGLTTLTQLGMPISVVATYQYMRGDRSWRGGWLLLLLLLVVISTIRAVIWSERLALLEVLIPSLSTAIPLLYRGQKHFGLVPLLAAVFLVLIFGVFESIRSWTVFSQTGEDYLSFALGRLLSYYSTSFNNAAAFLQLRPPDMVPINALRFVFDFPNPFTDQLKRYALDYDQGIVIFLASNLNGEFNLFSTPGAIIGETGLWIGSCELFILGAASGALYSSFIRGRLLGVMFYPVWLVGLLDMGRSLYWTEGRVVPAVLGGLLLLALYQRPQAVDLALASPQAVAGVPAAPVSHSLT